MAMCLELLEEQEMEDMKNSRSVIGDNEAPVNRKRKSTEMYPPTCKYMAISPPRFHKRKERCSGGRKSILHRHPSMSMSLEGMEEQEMEDMKKQPIKDIQENKNLFEATELPEKSSSKNMKFKPFNSTQVFKKLPEKEEPFQFTAERVPKKSIYKPIRVARFTYDCKLIIEELYSSGVPANKSTIPKKTKLDPFTFAEEDIKRKEEKEKKIQEIFVAERKAREFKASPLPKFYTSKQRNKSPKLHETPKDSLASTSSCVEPPPKSLKAKSPRVHYFTPKLERKITKPQMINLRTPQRPHEREEFEKQQLERDEYEANRRYQKEQEKKKQDAEEIARVRKESVHTPVPVPFYKKYRSTKINPLTLPESPSFMNNMSSK